RGHRDRRQAGTVVQPRGYRPHVRLRRRGIHACHHRGSHGREDQARGDAPGFPVGGRTRPRTAASPRGAQLVHPLDEDTMKTKIVTIILLTGLVAANGAWAQVPKLWHIGVSGGASMPMNDAKDVLKNGYNLQGFVSFSLPGLPMNLRAALNYESF